ncbi:MAG: DUF4255 domain-containing protein [Pyrinomonadaceae bacterium]
MSTALAIASVTAVLKDLLSNGLIDHDVSASVGDVLVSALPPDRIDALDTEKKSRLNIFMYQVTPNAGWRNVGLPSRDGRGERLGNPPLALDLHYLLTAYGLEEFHAEILLGYGMQLLHETPVLTRDAIRRTLTPPSLVTGGSGLPAHLEALFASELAEQVEQIKIVPQSLTTEEISRMWAAFGAKYRPTAAYQTSVVLIESRRSTKSALPVRARNIYVVPFKQPVIELIKSQATAIDPVSVDQPILAGHRLVLAGQQLRGEETTVSVNGMEVAPAAGDITETQIIVPLPPSLVAGVQGVQLIHRRLLGSPPVSHRGVESNVAAFVLRPRIIEPIGIGGVQGTGGAPRSATVNLHLEPAVGPSQRAVLLLNELVPTSSPPGSLEAVAQSYSFNVPARLNLQSPPSIPPLPSNNLSIPVSGVKAGTYLVRVQVDGAQSPLGTDALGRYHSPQLVIP